MLQNSPGLVPNGVLDHVLQTTHMFKLPHARGGARGPRSRNSTRCTPLATDPKSLCPPLAAPRLHFSRFWAAPRTIKKSAAPGRGLHGVVRLRSRYPGRIREDFPPLPSADAPGRLKIRKNPDKMRPGRFRRPQNVGFFRIFADLKSNQKFFDFSTPSKIDPRAQKIDPWAPKAPFFMDFDDFLASIFDAFCRHAEIS